jgi:cytochrome c biogenesis protein CcmG/thiol:disulfide interchange protein DsbE
VRLRLYWPVTIAAAALVGLLAYGVASHGPDTSLDEAVASGDRVAAPVAELPRLGAGGTGSLADHRGKVVVLNVWASWCGPCVEELPLLQRTHERIARRDAMVLGIDVQDASENAMQFERRLGITYPSLRDRDRDYVRELDVAGYPETFLVDRSGRIAALRRGPVTQAWLDRHLPPLLAEEA